MHNSLILKNLIKRPNIFSLLFVLFFILLAIFLFNLTTNTNLFFSEFKNVIVIKNNIEENAKDLEQEKKNILLNNYKNIIKELFETYPYYASIDRSNLTIRYQNIDFQEFTLKVNEILEKSENQEIKNFIKVYKEPGENLFEFILVFIQFLTLLGFFSILVWSYFLVRKNNQISLKTFLKLAGLNVLHTTFIVIFVILIINFFANFYIIKIVEISLITLVSVIFLNFKYIYELSVLEKKEKKELEFIDIRINLFNSIEIFSKKEFTFIFLLSILVFIFANTQLTFLFLLFLFGYVSTIFTIYFIEIVILPLCNFFINKLKIYKTKICFYKSNKKIEKSQKKNKSNKYKKSKNI